MKRVLLVTFDFPPRLGGVASYYSRIISALGPKRFFVLTDIHPDARDFDSTVSYAVFRRRFLTRLPLWPRWIFLVWHIFWLVRKLRVDVVLVGEVLPTGTAVLLLQRLLQLPFVLFTHGLDIRLPESHPRKAKLVRNIFFRSKKIVANSNYTAEALRKWGVPSEKIAVITPGVDSAKLHTVSAAVRATQQKYHAAGKRLLLSVGRLVERKGFDQVIRLLPPLLVQFPDLVYWIVGQGPDFPRLQKLALETGCADRIHFLGAVSAAELAACYQLCELFVLTPRVLDDGDVEGFGIVYLEAAYAGKPVIATRSGGVSEAVADGVSGLLVDPDNDAQLLAVLQRLLIDRAYAKVLGESGRKRVLAAFTWQKRADNLKSLLSETV